MRKIGFLLIFLSSLFSSPSVASEVVLDVAGEKVDQEDVIYLLKRQMGVDGDVAAVTWANMDDEQKKEFLSHVEDVVVLAEAGRLRGLSFNPEVRRELRWDEMNVLAKAYVDRISMNWSLDLNFLEAFYRRNLQRYAIPSRILAKIEKVSGDPSGDRIAVPSGEPSWYMTADLPGDVKDFIVKNFKLGKLPVIEGSDGGLWRVEILRSEGSRTLPFDVVKDRVARDLQADLLAKDLMRLRARFSTASADADK